MKMLFVGVGAVVSGVAALFCGAQWLRHDRMPFNSEGRHFDELEGVSYSSDALLGWGLGAGGALALCLLCGVVGWRHGRTAQNKL